ncbi:MAG: hypothetical protein U0Q03_00420 [Acidimicrobiales bacterium]
MHEPSPTPSFSRRTALAGGLAIAGGLVVAGPGGSVLAADVVPTYALDPTQGGACLAPSCITCNACQAHAANKLFASAADADAGRAHPGCRCTVTTGISVTQTVFDQLFAAGRSADRRTTAIASLLATPIGTVVAPGIGGLVPVVVTVGGLATIAWVAARRHQLGGPGPVDG